MFQLFSIAFLVTAFHYPPLLLLGNSNAQTSGFPCRVLRLIPVACRIIAHQTADSIAALPLSSAHCFHFLGFSTVIRLPYALLNLDRMFPTKTICHRLCVLIGARIRRRLPREVIAHSKGFLVHLRVIGPPSSATHVHWLSAPPVLLSPLLRQPLHLVQLLVIFSEFAKLRRVSCGALNRNAETLAGGDVILLLANNAHEVTKVSDAFAAFSFSSVDRSYHAEPSRVGQYEVRYFRFSQVF
mmetsp:Transcript_42286/g.89931  ORF Transcript_42286/g.89931 Transcript_42286/m.89931 type:complete len:241 (-) Transcript_42286:319-1041(-)